MNCRSRISLDLRWLPGHHVRTPTVSPTKIADSGAVGEYAKQLANGLCDLCGEPAPFQNKVHDPYLCLVSSLMNSAKSRMRRSPGRACPCPRSSTAAARAQSRLRSLV